jgi:hypothetical protein
MTMVFNSRPPPITGESFRGYLLRLTSLNGYSSVNGVMKLAGGTYSLEGGAPWLYSAKNLMSALEIALHIKKETLPLHFSYKPSGLFTGLNDEGRHQTYRNHAVLCPTCIKMNSYIPALWDSALYTTCHIHGSELVGVCPNCHTPIALNRPDFELCATCDAPYSSIQSAPTAQSPIIQKALKRLIARSLSPELLLNACNRVARPLDMMPALPQMHSMDTRQASDLIVQALGLIYSTTFRDRYRNTLLINYSDLAIIDPAAPTAPLDNFLKDHKLNQVKFFSEIAFTHEAFQPEVNAKQPTGLIEKARTHHVQAARFRSLRTEDHQPDLSHLIRADQLAELLNINVQHLKSLSDSGIVPSINISKKGWRLNFDIGDILKAIIDIKETAHDIRPTDPVSLVEVTHRLKNFDGNFGEVWRLLLQRRISTYMPNDFASLEVSESDLYFALHNQLISSNVEADELFLSRYWNTSIPLATAAKQELSAKFDLVTVGELTQNTVSISRISLFSGIYKSTLDRELRKSKLNPIFEESHKRNKLSIYATQDLHENVSVLKNLNRKENTRSGSYYGLNR